MGFKIWGLGFRLVQYTTLANYFREQALLGAPDRSLRGMVPSTLMVQGLGFRA